MRILVALAAAVVNVAGQPPVAADCPNETKSMPPGPAVTPVDARIARPEAPGCQPPKVQAVFRVAADSTLVSATTALAPKDAAKAVANARRELSKNNPNYNFIEGELERAVTLYPRFSDAWYLLGEVRLKRRDVRSAREAFHSAITADPNSPKPYVSLSYLELQNGQLREALSLNERALRLNPELVEASLYKALSLYGLGEHEASKMILRTLFESRTSRQHVWGRAILGEMLANEGDYRSAAVQYRLFLKSKTATRTAARIQADLNDWKLKGLID